jgi:hypothetical protein
MVHRGKVVARIEENRQKKSKAMQQKLEAKFGKKLPVETIHTGRGLGQGG